MKRLALVFLLLLFCSGNALAFECAGVPEFFPLETQRVSVSLNRIYWTGTGASRTQEMEEVCSTSSDLEIGVSEIRGREEEWFYCFHRTPRPRLECSVFLDGVKHLVMVRPAIVIRSVGGRPVRDTHAHLFVYPESNPEALRDSFVRAQVFELPQKPLVLDLSTEVLPGRDILTLKLHFHESGGSR